MNYVSKQFAGPNITGFISAIEDYFNTAYKTITDYLTSLSITTANEKHTEMIGKLIGFPRPLVQPDALDLMMFRFSVSYYRDVDIGFSTSYDGGSADGGLLSDVTTDTDLIYMDLTTYKEILRILSRAKFTRGRYSLLFIDEVCKYIAGEAAYTIEYTGTANDILITFFDVGTYAIYIAGYVLNYLFDSVPDITVAKETTV